MKLMRTMRRTALGSALANRMLRVKRSLPATADFFHRDPAANELIPGEGGTASPLGTLPATMNRKLLYAIGSGLLLAALAGWARHRRLI